MSKSHKSYFKREPRNKGHLKGFGGYPFCGLTCCGHCNTGSKTTKRTTRRQFRAFRRQETQRAISEGFEDYLENKGFEDYLDQLYCEEMMEWANHIPDPIECFEPELEYYDDPDFMFHGYDLDY